jgi:hypothetical protein
MSLTYLNAFDNANWNLHLHLILFVFDHLIGNTNDLLDLVRNVLDFLNGVGHGFDHGVGHTHLFLHRIWNFHVFVNHTSLNWCRFVSDLFDDSFDDLSTTV